MTADDKQTQALALFVLADHWSRQRQDAIEREDKRATTVTSLAYMMCTVAYKNLMSRPAQDA